MAAGVGGRSLRWEEGNGEEDLRSEPGGQEDAAENVPQQEEEDKMTPGGEAPAEPPGTAEATVEPQTKEDPGEAEEEGLVENGTEVDEEGHEDEDHVMEGPAAEPVGAEVGSKEVTVESAAPNPEESL